MKILPLHTGKVNRKRKNIRGINFWFFLLWAIDVAIWICILALIAVIVGNIIRTL